MYSIFIEKLKFTSFWIDWVVMHLCPKAQKYHCRNRTSYKISMLLKHNFKYYRYMSLILHHSRHIKVCLLLFPLQNSLCFQSVSCFQRFAQELEYTKKKNGYCHYKQETQWKSADNFINKSEDRKHFLKSKWALTFLYICIVITTIGFIASV